MKGTSLLLASFALALAACQGKDDAPSTGGGTEAANPWAVAPKSAGPAPALPVPTATLVPGAQIEIYAYINADTDLISDNGGAQGMVFASEIAAEAAKLGSRAILKTYLDPNSLLAKPGEVTDTTITVRQAGNLVDIRSLGETNSADPATFADFVSDIRPDPSVYRILILWGHGEGWMRVGGFDFSHPESAFSYQEIAGLLPEGSLDLVVFDACKMAALETLNAWSKVTRHVLATQMKLPVEGIRYNGMAEVLAGTELAQPAAVSIKLYEKLKKTTLDFHKPKGIFAPTVLYASEGVSAFNAALAPVLQEFANQLKVPGSTLAVNDIATASKPGFMLGFGTKNPTVDLRALLYTLETKAKISGQNVLEKFKSLSHQAYGSLSLYFPEMTATGLQDEAEVRYSKASSWTQGLANWELVGTIGKREGNTP